MTATPLTVPAETAHLLDVPPAQVGGTVPIPVPALAVGVAFVLHTKRKYGALLLSAAIARHCTAEPEFVGVDVEESTNSYVLRTNAGGVLRTVSVVEAVEVAIAR